MPSVAKATVAPKRAVMRTRFFISITASKVTPAVQVHKDHFYKDAGISRRALFKLMEPNANPTLESLAKVCRALAKAA